MNDSTQNTVTQVNNGAAKEVDAESSLHFHMAYARLKPTLDAIPPANFIRIIVDVGLVVQTVLGTLPELEKLKDAIVAECPRVSPQAIPNLKEAVLALGHLEVLKRGSKGLLGSTPGEPAARVRSLRDVLLADVQPLVARGMLDEKALALTPGNSPRNIAFDVLRLVNYLDDNWPRIQGRSLTTRADLETARSAAQDLITYLGVRDNAEGDDDLVVTRQRALTHLIDIYEELRWAVRYVRRREDDADTIIPSLYSLRKRSGGGSSDEPDTETDATQATPHAADSEIDTAHLQAVMAGSLPLTPTSPTDANANAARTNGATKPTAQ